MVIVLRSPEVFRSLPDRWGALSGKTVVIDGTLITQRLHFAPMPHQYRHVLGWYNLVKELKESGVRAICVFDGQRRTKAKWRELKRRKEVQQQASARAVFEANRLQRLRKLRIVLEHYSVVSDARKAQVGALLGKVTANDDLYQFSKNFTQHTSEAEQVDNSNEALNIAHDSPDVQSCPALPPSRHISLVDTPLSVPSATEAPRASISTPTEETAAADETTPIHVHKTVPVDKSNEVLHISQGSPDTYSSQEDPPSQPVTAIDISLTVASDADAASSPVPKSADETAAAVLTTPIDKDADNTPLCSSTSRSETPNSKAFYIMAQQIHRLLVLIKSWFEVTDKAIVTTKPSSETPENLDTSLLSLYTSYRQSIPTLTAPSDTSPPSDPLSQVDDLNPLDDTETRSTEYAMSKNQYQLTLEEGKIWEELSSPNGMQNADAILPMLSHKSNMMSESLRRRTDIPTSQTYQESKSILRAMGVPCVECPGEYEAEALASSLVLNGCADYVASEDTDVLVYEAPLLRNISNRAVPLIVVSGSEVRTVLQLERASYVDFALLLGTDFSQRIKNVGPHRALKFIREHGTIERILEHEPKFPPALPAEDYLEQVQAARMIFRTLPPVPGENIMQQGESNNDEVVEILQRCGLQRATMIDWDYASALAGNFFEDDPTAYSHTHY